MVGVKESLRILLEQLIWPSGQLKIKTLTSFAYFNLQGVDPLVFECFKMKMQDGSNIGSGKLSKQLFAPGYFGRCLDCLD